MTSASVGWGERRIRNSRSSTTRSPFRSCRTTPVSNTTLRSMRAGGSPEAGGVCPPRGVGNAKAEARARAGRIRRALRWARILAGSECVMVIGGCESRILSSSESLSTSVRPWARPFARPTGRYAAAPATAAPVHLADEDFELWICAEEALMRSVGSTRPLPLTSPVCIHRMQTLIAQEKV